MNREPESESRPSLDSDNARIRGRRKDDLFLIESTSSPRPDDVYERLVGRVEPLWGFAVYGVLYVFVAGLGLSLGLIPALILRQLGVSGIAFDLSVWIFAIGGFALAWLPFVHWVRRRRRRTLPLIRDGVLIEGVVIDKLQGNVVDVAKRVVVDAAFARMGARFYRVAIEQAGVTKILGVPLTGSARPAPGTAVSVLVHPQAKHALVFEVKSRRAICTST